MAMVGLELLDWVLNGTQVATKLMMLKKTWWAPVLGLVSQVLFVVYAFYTSQYGFLITPFVMTPLYCIFVKKWYKERYALEFVSRHEDEYYFEELEMHPNWTPWDVPHWPDHAEEKTVYIRVKKKKE